MVILKLLSVIVLVFVVGIITLVIFDFNAAIDNNKEFCIANGYNDTEYIATNFENSLRCVRFVPDESGVGYEKEYSGIIR